MDEYKSTFINIYVLKVLYNTCICSDDTVINYYRKHASNALYSALKSGQKPLQSYVSLYKDNDKSSIEINDPISDIFASGPINIADVGINYISDIIYDPTMCELPTHNRALPEINDILVEPSSYVVPHSKEEKKEKEENGNNLNEDYNKAYQEYVSQNGEDNKDVIEEVKESRNSFLGGSLITSPRAIVNDYAPCLQKSEHVVDVEEFLRTSHVGHKDIDSRNQLAKLIELYDEKILGFTKFRSKDTLKSYAMRCSSLGHDFINKKRFSNKLIITTKYFEDDNTEEFTLPVIDCDYYKLIEHFYETNNKFDKLFTAYEQLFTNIDTIAEMLDEYSDDVYKRFSVSTLQKLFEEKISIFVLDNCMYIKNFPTYIIRLLKLEQIIRDTNHANWYHRLTNSGSSALEKIMNVIITKYANMFYTSYFQEKDIDTIINSLLHDNFDISPHNQIMLCALFTNKCLSDKYITHSLSNFTNLVWVSDLIGELTAGKIMQAYAINTVILSCLSVHRGSSELLCKQYIKLSNKFIDVFDLMNNIDAYNDTLWHIKQNLTISIIHTLSILYSMNNTNDAKIIKDIITEILQSLKGTSLVNTFNYFYRVILYLRLNGLTIPCNIVSNILPLTLSNMHCDKLLKYDSINEFGLRDILTYIYNIPDGINEAIPMVLGAFNTKQEILAGKHVLHDMDNIIKKLKNDFHCKNDS